MEKKQQQQQLIQSLESRWLQSAQGWTGSWDGEWEPWLSRAEGKVGFNERRRGPQTGEVVGAFPSWLLGREHRAIVGANMVYSNVT